MAKAESVQRAVSVLRLAIPERLMLCALLPEALKYPSTRQWSMREFSLLDRAMPPSHTPGRSPVVAVTSTFRSAMQSRMVP